MTLTALWMVAGAALAVQPVAPIVNGNALTLPAQRHVLRIVPPDGRPVWLLSVQQDGADGNGLTMFRSDDETASWRELGAIQDDWSERDTTDMLAVGTDVALVYSYEGPTLSGSTRHDVFFQWWRFDAGARTWRPGTAIRVFDSTSSSSAYSRAELAIDSAGRIWVQAWKLETDGSSSAYVSVSTDGGATFSNRGVIATTAHRGGGRLLHLGSQLILVYAMHDGGVPTRMRLHPDSAGLDGWTTAKDAFSDGMYHGAACSAVADGRGGMHLVYKDEAEQLYYRFFNGSSWSSRTQLDSSPDWSMQAATTLVGNELFVYWNHVLSLNTNYQLRERTLVNGTWSSTRTVDDSVSWKGYLNSVPMLPTSLSFVPTWYGQNKDANSAGFLMQASVARTPTAPPPPPPDAGTPDAGTPPPDAGTPDAGVPDAGTPGGGADAGTVADGAVLFSDSFTGGSALSSAWTVNSGTWFLTNNVASTDRSVLSVATENRAQCTDCRVEAMVKGFGVPEIGVFLRGSSSAADRYELMLLGNGHVTIRRRKGNTTTVLADGVSGLSALNEWSTLSLSATGTGPVTLVAKVNGVVRLTVTDSAANALGAGFGGMATTNAGVGFDDFQLIAVGTVTPAPDAGTPFDAGVPDAGVRDAGTPDAGTPFDAGTPAPDAGTPRPDAGSPDAGTTTQAVIFSDTFDRPNASTLGSSWTVQGTWVVHSNRGGTDQDNAVATENQGKCVDCRVEADVNGFGTPETALFTRATTTTSSDRYDLALLSNGHLQIRRWRSGTATVLGDAASGLAALNEWSHLSLMVTGSGPVTLTALVNGAIKLQVTDASASSLVGSGFAGMSARSVGVGFDNFRLWDLAASPPGLSAPEDDADAGTDLQP